jgi:hypothetical protein
MLFGKLVTMGHGAIRANASGVLLISRHRGGAVLEWPRKARDDGAQQAGHLDSLKPVARRRADYSSANL